VFLYKSPLREALSKLLRVCGASIVGSVNNNGILIGFAKEDGTAEGDYKSKKPVYSHKWVLQSVAMGAMQALDKFVFRVPSSPAAVKNNYHKTPVGRRGLAASSVSSPEFTDDMDSAILNLAQTLAEQLEVEPSSPEFWKQAHKRLGFRGCSWTDVRDRYMEHLRELQVHVEPVSSSSGASSVGGIDEEEEDHQSHCGDSDDEDEVDEVEFRRKSFQSEQKLKESIMKVAGRPNNKNNKDLKKRSRGKNEPLTPKDIISDMAIKFEVSEKVAVHALLVNGGNVGKARRYLKGLQGVKPWTAQEDELVGLVAAALDGTVEALHQLSKTRSHAEIVARIQWLAEGVAATSPRDNYAAIVGNNTLQLDDELFPSLFIRNGHI